MVSLRCLLQIHLACLAPWRFFSERPIHPWESVQSVAAVSPSPRGSAIHIRVHSPFAANRIISSLDITEVLQPFFQHLLLGLGHLLALQDRL